MDSPAAKFYEAKAGFANHYFNKLALNRLLNDSKQFAGDFRTVQGSWTINATPAVIKGKQTTARISILDKGGRDGKSDKVEADIDGLVQSLEPLAPDLPKDAYRDPPGTGGLLVAMYQYRQMLAFGQKGFVGEFIHGGTEPFYLLPAEKERPDYVKLRVDCDVIRTKHAGVPGKWFFAQKDDPERKIVKGQLLGFEVLTDGDPLDPCEVYLSNYKDVGGRKLPGRIDVVFSDKTYGTFTGLTYKLEGVK